MSRKRLRDLTYRPYETDFHPQDLLERMDRGESNIEICADWGISEVTFYKWLDTHPELKDAYTKGLVRYKSWVIQEWLKPMVEGKVEGKHAWNALRAIARPDNLNLDNPTKAESSSTNININQVNVLQQKDQSELIEHIQNGLEFLKANNVIDVTPIEHKADDGYNEQE